MIYLVAPAIQGGVSDFTGSLNRGLGEDRCRTVIIDGHSLDIEVSAEDTLFLQFSGYGFQKRGVPLWLPGECRRLRGKAASFGIFFHELYAIGPPWRSAFWLSPVQRHIARELAKLCDFWMTTRERSAAWLSRQAGDKPHAALPVFSTIGEAADRARIRRDRVVIFGGSGLRRLTYQAAGDDLFKWAATQNLEIHDIGPPIEDSAVSGTLDSNQVIRHGRLPAPEVCRALSEAAFGVVFYPVDAVAKSSIFAAYCAHGACPILLSRKHEGDDGLIAGKHYLPGFPDGPVSGEETERIGEAAWSWYQPHRLDMHVRTLLELTASGSAGGRRYSVVPPI